MSCSRPINDVDVTGSEREPRRSPLDAGDAERSARLSAAANRSLRSRARSSRTSRPSSRGVRNVRYESVPSRLELVDHGRQPRFSVGRRCLDVQQPGDRVGESELVLESRDVHVRPDPAVPLPVQADEDVGLREVGPVQLARWVRSGTELEQHRREPQRRDGTGHRGTLLGELGQRGAHEDAQTLVRGPDRDVARLLLRHLSASRRPPSNRMQAPTRKSGARRTRRGGTNGDEEHHAWAPRSRRRRLSTREVW